MMGTGELHRLILCADDKLAGAVRSLWSELAAAEWECVEDLMRDFPLVQLSGHRAEIALSSQHSVVFAINFPARCLLVEHAGTKIKKAKLGTLRKRKRF